MDLKTIHIQWEGPLSAEEVSNLSDENKDFGIYQIYGNHPVYGTGTLLYIGKACKQTFAQRIVQQDWEYWEYCHDGSIQVRVGRLAGDETPSASEWYQQIDLGEKILINAHKPAHNSAMIGPLSPTNDKALTNIRVLNWGDYGDLLPEVSGDRWTDKWLSEKYEVYGAQR